eukprot:CAMPEP_0172906540 /NCGR_PEP_ID=MMETSP1075-20121228/177026_1 /TAXON_ID=2916 /ORGANISM="Ceratium fusus, Strain PA161109" /LENGTH=534 /DNA_ID=CAMNT_0013764001 /DNA_START=69 /DNA_END=1669 /DNA_ORIENTATION=+
MVDTLSTCQQTLPPGRQLVTTRRGKKGVLVFVYLALVLVANGKVARDLRPQLRWAQTNTSIFITVETPRGPSAPSCDPDSALQVEATLEVPDRLIITANCSRTSQSLAGPDKLRWEMALREDFIADGSRTERTGSTGVVVVIKKLIVHRWDRLLWDEAEASISKDWKREDRDLPDADEVELPKAHNILRVSFEGLRKTASNQIVVAALRYTWCTVCEEKDKAFVKATKVVGSKAGFESFVFAVADLREDKRLARMVAAEKMHECHKRCPLHVFKPDEPLDEPYKVEMQLLYEMDEYSMMTDPMAGAPGHTPKGQTAKPNFERFERDLKRLVPPALTHLRDADGLVQFVKSSDNVVLGSGVDATQFRRTARGLRGVAAFGLLDDLGLLPPQPPSGGRDVGEPVVELRAAEATQARAHLRFEGEVKPLASEELDHFVRVHVQPLAQNYSWDLKDKLEVIGLPVAVLWVNRSDMNNTNTTMRALEAFNLLCDRRRGTNVSRNVLCCIQDESYSYYQREYGSHEPYPYPFLGLTKKLG